MPLTCVPALFNTFTDSNFQMQMRVKALVSMDPLLSQSDLVLVLLVL